MSLATNRYVTLVRREYWEHRSLWLGPLVVAGIVLILILVAGINVRNEQGLDFNPGDALGAGTSVSAMAGQVIFILSTTLLGCISLITIFAYLLDSLYGERKDRSILFWKSLPVSDTQTVLVKLGVAMIVTPLLVLLLAILVQPLLLGVLSLRIPAARMAIDVSSIWQAWRMLPNIGMAWLFGILWYAPLGAWLMLASVLAKRVPLMYAVMPPVTLMLIETIVLGDNRIATFIGQWLFPWPRVDWVGDVSPERGVLPSTISPDWAAMYATPSLWIGLAVAAGLIYAVIRLRRYRDDT